jgi:hypothetical protein
MSPEQRLAASDAFWKEGNDQDGVHAQHVEAVMLIARRLNFRPKSVQALPVERRARQLAHLPDVSDAVITRALIAYHLAAQRPLMGAFLDALGIAHEDGVIQDETVAPPDKARLAEAANALNERFPASDVTIYLNTLLTQDPDTWAGLDGLPQLSA